LDLLVGDDSDRDWPASGIGIRQVQRNRTRQVATRHTRHANHSAAKVQLVVPQADRRNGNAPFNMPMELSFYSKINGNKKARRKRERREEKGRGGTEGRKE